LADGSRRAAEPLEPERSGRQGRAERRARAEEQQRADEPQLAFASELDAFQTAAPTAVAQLAPTSQPSPSFASAPSTARRSKVATMHTPQNSRPASPVHFTQAKPSPKPPMAHASTARAPSRWPPGIDPLRPADLVLPRATCIQLAVTQR
jgi:hypothetical protein